MSKCFHHPGIEGVTEINGLSYCANCKKGIHTAVSNVDRHVEPKNCFVWYANANNWKPIAGTGCAHWVAHQLNIRAGGRGEKCLLGFTYRVRTLIQGRRPVPVSDVQLNDIYVTPHVDHTGIVIKVIPANPTTHSALQITIRHDSSGQGGVAENDFTTYFHKQGSFYR